MLKVFFAKRNIVILIIIALIIGASVYYFGSLRREDDDQAKELFPEEEKDVDLAQETISFIEENIDKLSPERPTPGAFWEAVRLALVDENNLYVEYEDGQLARRLLLSHRDENWEMIGFFDQGKDMWHLVSGKDLYFGKPVTIYEKNEELGEWRRK